MRSVVPYVWVLLGLSGCVNPYDREGTRPFECHDGADNDDDGYFDCDDNGCWDSPDCGGGPDDTGDTDTGGDTDTDTDTSDTDTSDTDTDTSDTDTDTSDTDTDTAFDTGDCTNFLCDYTTVDILMTHDVDAPDGLCTDLQPACDCVVTFEGHGDIIEVDGWRVTFAGTWQYVSSTATNALETTVCDAYAAGVWQPTSSVQPEAYHSIQFKNTGSQLDVWVVHQSLSGYEPIKTGGALAAGQYPIWDMHRPWTQQSLTTTHTEEVPWAMDDTYLMNTTVTATFTFNE